MKYLLNEAIIAEIEYLSDFFQVDRNILYHIVYYALACQQSTKNRQKIPLKSLKKTIFLFFEVNSTQQLKRSKRFQRMIKELAPLNLKLRQDWERLYEVLIDKFSGENKEFCSVQNYFIEGEDVLEFGELTHDLADFDVDVEENLSIEEIERAFQRCRYAELN